MFNNQAFCYWLQGYFEIAEHPILTKEHIKKIKDCLTKIEEPLGVYTSWLNDVLNAIEANHYHQPIIQYFSPMIQDELNQIFAHVIDNSYETHYSNESLQAIHDGRGIA